LIRLLNSLMSGGSAGRRNIISYCGLEI
jgi:hypothetical protein